jgi:putative restriction endonuclease
MTYENHFKEEFDNSNTQYFILDTKGGGKHGDVDFVQYEWSRSRFNRLREGDVFICRRPGGQASETGKFYFFGAAKVGTITGTDRVTAKLIKPYPFQDYLHQEDLEDFKWTWKERGETWEHFFNQYGMNRINKVDFINLLKFSESSVKDYDYDPAAATDATQGIQKHDYSVDDHEGLRKIRAKQGAFSNTVKTNYGKRCAICSITTSQFLIGSHIIPWSVRKDIRLDPSNGICLCALHDKAFDNGFITIDKNHVVVITQRVKNDTILFALLKECEGKKLRLPKTALPDNQYLEYHRVNIFDKFK